MHLVNGTGNSPSPGQPTPRVVKQDKSSGGSVDTTKTRSGPQRVRMSSGERPIGAAKGKQSDTEALCQTPPEGQPWLVPYALANARLCVCVCAHACTPVAVCARVRARVSVPLPPSRLPTHVPLLMPM